MPELKFKPLRYRQRWFCYLDLLGFTNLVNSETIERVMPTYLEIIAMLSKHAMHFKARRLLHSWFSDTFVIYSRSTSYDDFRSVEYVGRRFFEELIANEIPVRGAITCGGLYSQSTRNVFVGPALIDAYKYAEGQDWLGFVLTPTAKAQLQDDELQILRNYHPIQIEGAVKPTVTGPVLGFTFVNSASHRQNQNLAALENMRAKAGQSYRAKYDRTIEFIHACARLPIEFP
jgi:hypothetical protein